MTAPLLSVTVRPGMEETGADGAEEPPSEEEEESSGITGPSGSTGRGIETCLMTLPSASVVVTFAPGPSLSLMVSSSSSLPACERALPLGLPALAVSSRLPDRSMTLLMMPLPTSLLLPLPPLPPAALTVPPEMATWSKLMMPLPPLLEPLLPLPPLALTVPPEMVRLPLL